jgi:hypothetical protein
MGSDARHRRAASGRDVWRPAGDRRQPRRRRRHRDHDEHCTSDPEFWERNGFELEEIETSFEFETHEEADRLLGFYFGDRRRDTGKLRFTFRVGLYFNRSRGSSR